MNNWTLVGLITGIAVGYFIFGRKQQGKESLTDVKAREHAMMIEKAVTFTHDKETITNDELQKYLGVSNSSAERYLDELEHQGILRQVGRVGTGVSYKVL